MTEATPETALARLARALVGNHIRLSIQPELQQTALDTIVASGARCTAQRAVVVVVGAGASLDAVALPAAEVTAREVRSRLKVPPHYYEAELSRLARQFRLDPNDFETQMLALGKFEPNELRTALVQIFGRRFYVAECYEILAHLLKHRFIDTIINFNFDEILDQAIGDEVEEGNYYRIISDGDLPSASIRDAHGRLKRPLYIKPHGTFSHGSSLRFTREAYILIPELITELILKCLTSAPVTLVTVGFRMRSVEFQAIINDAVVKHDADIEVIAIDPSPDVLAGFAGFADERLHRHDPGTKGLASTFEQLWAEVGRCFAKEGFARDIQRHKLLAQLFPEKPQLRRPENERGRGLTTYLKDRALVELALAVAKAKGFVHVGQLAGSRAGNYLREYRNAKPSGRTLHTLCELLQLHEVGYSRDTLRLLPSPPDDSASRQLIIGKDEWPNAKKQLVDSVGRSLEAGSRQSWAKSDSGKKLLNDVFESLYNGDEVEVISSRSSRRTLLFESAEELPSFAATRIYTDGLLNDDWDLLWCVAESGDWLTKDDRVQAAAGRPNRGIAVIVADLARKQEIETKYKDIGVKAWVMALPWWLHNQHMTIAVKGGTPRKALFFERRLRSLAINPLGLDNPKDLKVVEGTFHAYWAKAKQQVPGAAFVRSEDVKSAQAELRDIKNWPPES